MVDMSTAPRADMSGIWAAIGTGDSGDRLARPVPVRDQHGRLRRNPAGEWDWFYTLDSGLQSWIRRNVMGADGLTPDDCAAITGHGYDVDAWAATLVDACKVARDRGAADDWSGEYAQDDDDDLIGPHELAALVGVHPDAVRKMRQRDQLPEPFAVLSNMPIWTLGAVRTWAAETGRTLDAA